MCWSTRYKNGVLEEGILAYIMHSTPFVTRKSNWEHFSIYDFGRLELSEDHSGFKLNGIIKKGLTV
jgi:hypothetical protein